MQNKPKIAIIGAGLSGLVAAHSLKNKFDVTVFEKARGVGGRMATRRADPYQFDHGAQYFNVTSQAFKSFLAPYIKSNLVAPWKPEGLNREEQIYVCAPRMNSLCKFLEQDIKCKFSVEIQALHKREKNWFLEDKTGQSHGPYDWVISSAPSPQAVRLMPADFTFLKEIKDVKMTGCFSLMLGFETVPEVDFEVLTPKNSLIGWIAVNSKKPSRDTAYSVLIQTTNEWAEAHMEDDPKEVEAMIVDEFIALTGIRTDSIAHKACHRWRYANTLKPAETKSFIDENLKIGVCGDWCIGGRIEAAFLSADDLSKNIINSLA